MATLPDINARRPAPSFGRVNQVRPVVQDPDVAVGRSIQGFGNAMLETFLRAQAREDKYMVEDATTKLKQASLDLAKGENGYLGVKAGDVDKNFHEERMRQFDDARTTIAEGLGNNTQARAFEARAELARINYGEGLINHITEQNDVKQTMAYTSGVATEQDSAMINADNPSEVYQSIDRIKDLTTSELDRRGVTDADARELMIKENVSGAHARVVQALVDDRNYGEAREWYIDNREEIMGETQSKIEKLLDAAGKEDRSQALVDGMWDEFQDDPAGGRKYIRDTANPEDRDESLRRFNTRLAEGEQAQKQHWADLQDESYSTYIQGREDGLTPSQAYYSIPPSVREEMKQTHRMALYNMMQADSRGSAIHTDPETYLNLYNMATGTPEEKRRFREEIDLRDYIGSLSIADFKGFTKLQGSEDDMAIASTMANLKADVAQTAGFGGKKSEKKTAGIFALNQRFDEELIALQTETGKEATTVEARAVADRLKIKIIRERSFTNWFEDTMYAGTAEIEGVPTEMIDELAFRLSEAKRAGLAEGEEAEDVTEKEIQDYYTWLLKSSPTAPVIPPAGSSLYNYPNPNAGRPPE